MTDFTRDIVTDFRHLPSSGYKEIDYMRKTYIEACRKRGFVLVVRQKITDVMFTASQADPTLPPITTCPRCYDPTYGDAAQIDCPVCWGTGYTGGYLPPVLTFGTIFTQGHDVKFVEGVGRYVEVSGRATLAHYPLVLDGDLVAQVADYDTYGAVGDVLGVYYVDNVNHNPYQGKLKPDKFGVTDAETPTVIYQDWDSRALPPLDPRLNLPFRMEP
jgi:hypothetical protein